MGTTNKDFTHLAFRGASCTLNQRRFITKLYTELEKPSPDFNQINRGEAHRIIENSLHNLHRKKNGLPVVDFPEKL